MKRRMQVCHSRRWSFDLADATREGLETLVSPSYKQWEWTKATLIHLGLTSSPNKKILDHTATPEKSCVHFILLFEALLLHRPLPSHLVPFLTPCRLTLAYAHGSHTGQWGSQTVITVPFPVCGTLQSCSWMPVVDPSHWTSFLWNT